MLRAGGCPRPGCRARRVRGRDFGGPAPALAGAALRPAAARADRPAGRTAEGVVVVFQGDSITDCGRNRTVADPNAPAALGSGYPLLVTAAALAAHPDRGLRFYNRGVSGNKVPDLQERWAVDALELQPDVLSILIGVNDFWHKLSGGYTRTVADYESQIAAPLEETPPGVAPERPLLVLLFVVPGR